MKLTEVYILKEAKCGICGHNASYEGFCKTQGCPNQDVKSVKNNDLYKANKDSLGKQQDKSIGINKNNSSAAARYKNNKVTIKFDDPHALLIAVYAIEDYREYQDAVDDEMLSKILSKLVNANTTLGAQSKNITVEFNIIEAEQLIKAMEGLKGGNTRILAYYDTDGNEQDKTIENAEKTIEYIDKFLQANKI